ncbi:sensor histidine kinase [Brachybacterium kimchii]|uniref:Histidine kinase n=1 Tax=Brachybacterium kimchii TaxID=2942909 RepID=A0ABY4N1K6_9MICO|nr:histidine kinase [Brachybacterium kimchii]UQN28422.1 histidine kinase [Brachybacterium kimchii]
MSTLEAPDVGRPWEIFRVYTLWSLAVLMLLLPLLLLSAPGAADAPLLAPEGALRDGPDAAFLVLQSLTSAVSVLVLCRAWARGEAGPRGRWDLPEVGALRVHGAGARALALSPLVPAALAAARTAWADDASAHAPVLLACLGAALTGQALRLPWTTGILAAGATAGVGVLLGTSRNEASILAGLVIAFVAVARSSLWLAAIVRDLERARVAQAQLAVAEERLRFARDLHDVTGRDLSAIVVTAELTGKLVEREDPRALERSREVAQIARSSLAEVRALVRGYREADLAAELQGTVSLLRSAGIEAAVGGSPEDIPGSRAATAAWVLREAGTNVLRHSSADSVRIDLAPGGITVVNDGVSVTGTPVVMGSGLRGVRERLAPEGTLTARLDGERFVLSAVFEDPGEATNTVAESTAAESPVAESPVAESPVPEEAP